MYRNVSWIFASVLVAALIAGCAPSKAVEQQGGEDESAVEEDSRQQDDSAEASSEAAEDDQPTQRGSTQTSERTVEIPSHDADACEPLSEDAPDTGDGTITAEYEEFRTSAREYGVHQKHSDAQRDIYQVPRKRRDICSSWLDMPVPEIDDREFEGDCTVEFQHGGQLAVNYQMTHCGGDACTIRYFVWDGSESSPKHVKLGSDFSNISIAPRNEIMVFGLGVMPPGERQTYRLDVSTGDVCLLTEKCFSPTIAPDGETVLCRNRDSDVLAMSLDGGEPRVIVEVELDESMRVYIRPQWGEFPDPVRFLENGKVEYKPTVEAKPTGSGEPEDRVETFEWPS